MYRQKKKFVIQFSGFKKFHLVSGAFYNPEVKLLWQVFWWDSQQVDLINAGGAHLLGKDELQTSHVKVF